MFNPKNSCTMAQWLLKYWIKCKEIIMKQKQLTKDGNLVILEPAIVGQSPA